MSNTSITLSELEHYLMLDPYYGQSPAYAGGIIAGIYKDQEHDDRFMEFSRWYSLLPCKSNELRLLVYLWMGLYLPAYWDNQKICGLIHKINESNIWTWDLEFSLSELKQFLRLNQFPLPTYFYPNEPDSTKNKTQKPKKEYERTVYNLTVLLPEYETELDELQNIEPESIAASRKKKRLINKLEQIISSIRHGNTTDHKESPLERARRIKTVLDEERRLRGEKGAVKRTADREGLSRQRISQIISKLKKNGGKPKATSIFPF